MQSKERSISRKRIMAIAWLLCVPVAAQAQEEPSVLREAGALVSIARTTYGGQFIEDSPAERIPVQGFAAGVFARLEFARPGGIGLGLQPELGYGPRAADVELDGNYEGNVRTNYLELPVLARVEAPALGPAALYVVTGPTLSFLLRAKSESGTGNISDTRSTTSKLDIGLAAGLGASVAVGSRMAVSLEARYVHGFLTTADSGESEILNRAIFFSLGVSAKFGIDATVSQEE